MGPGATRESASAALNAVLGAIETATQPANDSSPALPKAHIPQFGTFQYAPRRSGLKLTFRPAASLLREYGKGA